MRRYPVSKAVLVLGLDRGTECGERAREAAFGLMEDLGSVPCDLLYVDLYDVAGTARDLVARIRSERVEGFEVLLNLSGAPGAACIAGYLAAQVSGAKAYVGVPEYSDGGVVSGARDVAQLPMPRLLEHSALEGRILSVAAFAGAEGVLFGGLLDEVSPGLSEGERDNERARISYHLEKLKGCGLIEAVREGRETRIKATGLGQGLCGGVGSKAFFDMCMLSARLPYIYLLIPVVYRGL